jgi:hypothetical protein
VSRCALANLPLSSRFPQYVATSAEPLLVQLQERCPVLRQICDRVDKNFYQFLRERGRIVHLPKYCINGLAVSIGSRKDHTLPFLLAGPGELEEPGDVVEEEVGKTMGERKDGSDESQTNVDMVPTDVEDIAGAADEYFDCLED